MNRTLEWFVTILSGIIGGGVGIGAVLLLMMMVGSIDPFNPYNIIFYFAFPFLGGFGAIIGGKIAGHFLDKKNSE